MKKKKHTTDANKNSDFFGEIYLRQVLTFPRVVICFMTVCRYETKRENRKKTLVRPLVDLRTVFFLSADNNNTITVITHRVLAARVSRRRKNAIVSLSHKNLPKSSRVRRVDYRSCFNLLPSCYHSANLPTGIS